MEEKKKALDKLLSLDVMLYIFYLFILPYKIHKYFINVYMKFI